MKFKNKKTGVVVETTVKEIEEMYKNKSEYEEVKEVVKPKEPTKAEIQAKLDELGIEYEEKASKAELLALLPQE
ncbi:MAG: hypothetical protein HFJ60_09000 [Clostridia bacterium]|jgi:hypothetical protein|nr:hypothetical protein [Clostridia bacterium]